MAIRPAISLDSAAADDSVRSLARVPVARPPRGWRSAAWVALLLAIAPALDAAVFDAGPGYSYPTLASLPSLAPGDEVRLHPGTYTEAIRWSSSGTSAAPILIHSVGYPRPIIDATSLDVSGVGSRPRAAFQIEGSHIIVDGVVIRGARNGHNGAGLRVTGAVDVTVRNCLISGCDSGVMSDGCDQVLIDGCEIASNGAGDGTSHNLYMLGGTIALRSCWVHDAVGGQNVKTRAHFISLLYNRIEASAQGEIGIIDDATQTTSPNSNAILIGNTVVSIVRPVGDNSVKYIVFGQDTGGVRNGTLYAFGNTFIAGTNHIRFLDATCTGVNLVASGNIFVGSDNVVMGTWQSATGSGNWSSSTAVLPSGLTGTVHSSAPGFVAVPSGNVRLNAGSVCIDRAPWSAAYLDGTGAICDGTPTSEFLSVGFLGPRANDGKPDAGAYEFVPVNTAPMISPIADVTVAQSGQAVATGAIADRETANTLLDLHASSSDPLLLPSSGIQIANNPSGLAINLTPTPNRNGSATVTLSVSDGALVTTRSFRLTVTPLSSAPWVSGIPSQQITAGVTSAPIAFTVSDPSGLPGSVAMSGWSTDQSVIRDSDLAFAGNGENRSVTITPAAVATGTATVWLQGSDGAQSGYTSFQVTVVPRVVAPTVTAPAPLVVAVDHTAGPLGFTLADATATTTVSATSSNQALVPDANLTLGGSGASRTITVRPASGARGSTTITLLAANGGLSGSASFVVTVRAPPTIAPLTDLVVPVNLATGPIAITLADSDVPVGSLVLTAMSTNESVVASSNIVFSGSGANRTMVISSNNTGAWGNPIIIVTVSDGVLTSSTSFMLSVWVPPILRLPADQVIAVGGTTGPLAVTVGDPQVPLSALTLTATSSNQALVPDAAITLSGRGGPAPTVTVTPAPGAQGTATISLSLADGTMTTTASFQVTVRPPPSITTPADAVIAQNGSLAIPFSIGDAQLPVSALTVTASASDPTANVQLAGTGTQRTVTVTPAPGSVGAMVVSLGVSDGALASSTSFQVTVRTPPTIAVVADQVIDQDQVTGPIALSVGSAQIAATLLVVTGSSSNSMLVPATAMVFGGSGASRSLTITPVAGQVGTATMVLTVSDGALTTSTGFTLTVRPVNHAPSITSVAATPNTASSSSLAVIANDDGGEAALTYTWTATGPAPLVFSVNASNAAKATTATFAAAGTYVLTATAVDAQGLAASGAVTVVIAQQATAVQVTPATASVQTGDSLLFTASVRDQFGAALGTQPTVAWTVSGGGRIAASGAFTAGATTGGPFAVTATTGPLAGSGSVTVTTPPFHGADVGSVSPIGTSKSVNGVWTVQGSGGDIWGTADAFQYARYVVGGDVQITARVDSITNTDAWAKAGVMIRESLDPGSKQAFTCVTAQNGVAYQRRTVTGAASVHTPGPLKAAPYWVRLSRIGTTVTSSCSADGVTWQVVATETLSLSAKVYIGLAVTSHHNGTLCTAVFSNVAVVSAPSAAN